MKFKRIIGRPFFAIRYSLWLLTICYPLFNVNAQSLSRTGKISLLTVSPGEELYSAFGHSALWVFDYERGIDRVYNYGTFDFRTEGFYIKFVQGTLPYTLSVSSSYNILEGSRQSNRSVTEQELNLSATQKEKLFLFLETNYLPENRQYFYKFFYDNCSTRLRDALKAACGDSLVYSNRPILSEDLSYRQWMNLYLQNHKPIALGMNIAIGLPSDKICTPQQEMYLPDNLMMHFGKAKLGGQNLVKTKKIIVEKIDTKSDSWGFIADPSFFFLVVYAFYSIFKRWKGIAISRYQTQLPLWFDKTLLAVLGFIGLILTPLWFLTDHGVTDWNQSLLIFIPFHIIVLFFLDKPAHYQWLSEYFVGCLVVLIAGVLISVVGAFWKGVSFWPTQLLFFYMLLGERYYSLSKQFKH